MSQYSHDSGSAATIIPLTTRRQLSSPASGAVVSVEYHGLDVDLELSTGSRFSLLFEDARCLVRLCGPNLLGRVITYDGRSLAVRGVA